MDERLFKLPAAIGPRGKVSRLGGTGKGVAFEWQRDY